MIKRISLALILGLLLSIFTMTAVSAGGAKNGEYFDWVSGGNKSGYFKVTGSGIVHMWSYDRPAPLSGDVHFIFKPNDKFPNATCDVEAVWVKPNYSPAPLYSKLDPEEKTNFLNIFTDLDMGYLGCGYQMD